jgi:hypothetical protein
MAYNPGANESFTSGVEHLTNAGHANDNSMTLGGSLQADSERWNSLTPHAVLNAATGASSHDDGSWERY